MIENVETSPPAEPAQVRRWTVFPRALTITMAGIISTALLVQTIVVVVQGGGVLDYVAIALSAVGAALCFRWPLPGLALVTAAAPVGALGSLETAALWSVACFVAFLLTLRGSSALLVGGVTAASNLLAAGWDAGTLDVRVNSAASVAAFAGVAVAAIGSAVRGNLRYRQAAEQRILDAEVARATAVERGVARERLRIARDLHDGVGHQVAVVSMRIGAAEVHLPPGEASEVVRADLAAAREGMQAVLRETQNILRVLRMPDDGGREESNALSLHDLVDACRTAGMEIEAEIDELPDDTEPQSAAAVFRIVQEALTNAQKHGIGPVSVSVASAATSGEILVEVANPSRRSGARAAFSGGNGLVGMRERAESAGGRFEVVDDGRAFRVRATIPHRGREPR